jgi:hypothetical protein
MKKTKTSRKVLSMLTIAALFVPLLLVVGLVPVEVRANALGGTKIVFDMTHGQYSAYVIDEEDAWLKNNLTALGYDVVFAYGGLNSTILDGAAALLIGGIYGEDSGFAQAEIDAVSEWFNTGSKFLWVGSDSDYGDGQYIIDNATAILEECGSHVYPEPTQIADAESNCGDQSYRCVANVTSDHVLLDEPLNGVDAILMHGPTFVYGSTSGIPGAADAVSLEDTTIENVFPMLYYSPAATISDTDLTPPFTANDGDQGAFTATTVELDAGAMGSGVIVVSGASPYGDYQPMSTEEYYGVPLQGMEFVTQTIHWGLTKAMSRATIVFDMTHGQYSAYVIDEEDAWLKNNLTSLGYKVVFAYGGLNSSILADVDGLLIGGIYGEDSGLAQAEIDAVADWYNVGHKFLWVGSDSDYGDGQYIIDNATAILESVGSHVYPEPSQIADAESNCGDQSYRCVANVTSDNPLMVDILDGVDQILMHGPTFVYGSTSGNPGAADAVSLEDTTIENVYPVLYYSPAATISDTDLTPPFTANDGDQGAFTATTVELKAGEDESGVLVVAGASPYGDYQPMSTEEYYGVPLQGMEFVTQTIDWGIKRALSTAVVVIDMTHGQYSAYVIDEEDAWLKNNLSVLGYDSVYAYGGINDTILTYCDALIIGGIYGEDSGLAQAEIDAIADWFNEGYKFLWVGSDSDYGDGQYIIDNATAILESVGSHVYPEPTQIADAESNCGDQSYRCVANVTSDDPFVADLVEGVEAVLMHGPTFVYGSTSGIPGAADAVSLEDTDIENVYPLLYYSPAATISDTDLTPPYTANDGDQGAFTASTIEFKAGAAGTGVIAVSGASPYGDYQPMSTEEYYGVPLQGMEFVTQTIDHVLKGDFRTPAIDHPADVAYTHGDTGSSITWNPTDIVPDNYEIYRDATLVDSGAWDGSAITISVDGLSPGTYVYKCLAYNDLDIFASDEVTVTVAADTTDPTTNSPEDLTYTVGQEGNKITWTVSDDHPASYEITRDGVVVADGDWTSDMTTISINVDGLDPGIYEFVLTITDIGGNTASDTVVVNVAADMTLIYIGVGAGVVVILIIIVLMKRR